MNYHFNSWGRGRQEHGYGTQKRERCILELMETEPGVILYNSLIIAYAKAGNSVEAFSVSKDVFGNLQKSVSQPYDSQLGDAVRPDTV